MKASPNILDTVPLPGLSPDSLGNYLASLGLLRVLARNRPRIRIAWHDDVLHVVEETITLESLLDELMAIADNRTWTPYERGWAEAQKKSSSLSANRETSAKSGHPFDLWQGEAGEEILETFSAHIVPHAMGRSFNPLLGDGGMKGRRVFSTGWQHAINVLATPQTVKSTRRKKSSDLEDDARRNELNALLKGEPVNWAIEGLSAGSWFSVANRRYNDGQPSGQTQYREGLLSPWAMALACEGISFFAGGASRRLGSRSRAFGAFPFATRAAAPTVTGEAGRDVAEIWAPLWERPMALPEVRALYSRGRAEIRGRGALTPSAFTTAIMRRGVDAGIYEFRRFVLGRTTSAKTFEPRSEGGFKLQIRRQVSSVNAISIAHERLLGLIDNLPTDRKVGKRWRFVGLRGPIERALLRLAATSDDPDAARAVLDAVVESLDRVDRNRSYREKRVSWEPLPIDWLAALFAEEEPSVEARLALAMVSAFPSTRPFAIYRFGVDLEYGRRFVHPERPPKNWVWRPGALPAVLSAVLLRRILDWPELEDTDDEPTRSVFKTASAYVNRWMEGLTDDELLSRWISRLALFDWSDWRQLSSVIKSIDRHDFETFEANGRLSLFGLFQPLFDLRPVYRKGLYSGRDMLPRQSGARTPAVARSLANQIRAGQIDLAVRLAKSRYAMAGTDLSTTNIAWNMGDPERLFASTLFPIFDLERTELIERWVRPKRQKGYESYE